MAHVVFCDNKESELDNIMNGKKTMLIRGGESRKIPHSRVFNGDEIYFVDKGNKTIVGKAQVIDSYNFVKLKDQEITEVLNKYQEKLLLSEKKKSRVHKRCLCLIEFDCVEKVDPIEIEHRSPLEDWLITDELTELVSNR